MGFLGLFVPYGGRRPAGGGLTRITYNCLICNALLHETDHDEYETRYCVVCQERIKKLSAKQMTDWLVDKGYDSLGAIQVIRKARKVLLRNCLGSRSEDL